MVHILFETNAEALAFMRYMIGLQEGAERSVNVRFDSGSSLLVKIEKNEQPLWLDLLTDTFHTFLLKHKLFAIIEQIIIQKYFYQENEEINSILDMAGVIMDEDRAKGKFPSFRHERNQIREGLAEIAGDNVSFSFSSFMKFRLKSLQEKMEPYAARAIDEYKLEHDYQSFIAALRDELFSRMPKMETLHLVCSEGYRFYDREFKEIDRKEMASFLDRRLLIGNSIYIDSLTLAPLLSIAPDRLYMYCDEPEDGLVQTIGRIFEERTVMLPLAAFHPKNGEKDDSI
ncbi:putative sporulation protein YtxC [Bacillus massiliglaciei]|uniref:putative sporulation protein YtxC n=1 Tax=Bacillus massiliglaciei TaxID=1816693 RepID=UPI0018FE47C7|nr:putative sporulation protein YtxC [Bacillus massiliglaciei]